jgi:para-aminobenzoate synthetase/4-amino-4-deoxychorismate lyase
LSDVLAVVAEAEAATERGLWAVGWLAYEAAGAFDPALVTHPPRPRLPLAHFALYPAPALTTELPEAAPAEIQLAPDLDAESFANRIAGVHAAIARGDTYQVNLTFRLNGDYAGDPWRLFARLQAAQPGGYGAYIDARTHVVASASPELFWRLDGDTIVVRPMKGTRPRGRWPTEDQALAAELTTAEKDRAENVMIVDMARNDLGRIARVGSVKVPTLFEAEGYPTLWQMTSTVTAETRAGLGDILRATFPCASITGAPKASTMRLIHDLEDTPRGVYTGAIGYWAPGRQAQFSVAIRTAVIDRQLSRVTYGVGSGVIWDSRADDEYRECLLKGRALTESPEAFELFETLRWTSTQGFWLEAFHLERLAESAARFGFPYSGAHCRDVMAQAVAGENRALRVRLTLDRRGRARAVSADAPAVAWDAADPARAPLPVRVAESPIDSQDLWLYHKTTRRGVYERALAQARLAGPCEDVILWNERGEVTETTIGNLVVACGGRLVTPPVSAGLLAGTFRRWLVESGVVQEDAVPVAVLAGADALWRVNGLRGWERVVVDRF